MHNFHWPFYLIILLWHEKICHMALGHPSSWCLIYSFFFCPFLFLFSHRRLLTSFSHVYLSLPPPQHLPLQHQYLFPLCLLHHLLLLLLCHHHLHCHLLRLHHHHPHLFRLRQGVPEVAARSLHHHIYNL